MKQAKRPLSTLTITLLNEGRLYGATAYLLSQTFPTLQDLLSATNLHKWRNVGLSYLAALEALCARAGYPETMFPPASSTISSTIFYNASKNPEQLRYLQRHCGASIRQKDTLKSKLSHLQKKLAKQEMTISMYPGGLRFSNATQKGKGYTIKGKVMGKTTSLTLTLPTAKLERILKCLNRAQR